MRIDKLDSFKAKMLRMPAKMREELRTAVATGADEIVELQQRTVPVDDGDLKASIRWRWGDEAKIPFSTAMGVYGRTELAAVITAGNTKVRYAHLVEFGARPHIAGGMFAGAQHPGAPAQPFFYPSWRLGKKRSKDRIARASRKAIKEVCA
jgi:hypothetical protein